MNDDDDGDFLRSSAAAGGVRILHDWSTEESIVGTIVAAVTEMGGDEPEELVHDRIDPDALEALFRPVSPGRRRDRGFVTFPLGDFDVTVDASGMVLIDER